MTQFQRKVTSDVLAQYLAIIFILNKTDHVQLHVWARLQLIGLAGYIELLGRRLLN